VNTIKIRGERMLNLQQFNNRNNPEYVRHWTPRLQPPDQYILRMLIRKPHGNFMIPKYLEWLRTFIVHSLEFQQTAIGITHPYCYITVRSGLVTSTTDDEWHLDGFSTNISHLPEQNYIWCDSFGTEFTSIPIEFPSDFSGSRHNINHYIQDTLALKPQPIVTAHPDRIYCFDPYVIHRRPQIPNGIRRTFIRLSFIPIEIIDDNCTRNPLLPTPIYGRHAVKDFRDKLERYKVA